MKLETMRDLSRAMSQLRDKCPSFTISIQHNPDYRTWAVRVDAGPCTLTNGHEKLHVAIQNAMGIAKRMIDRMPDSQRVQPTRNQLEFELPPMNEWEPKAEILSGGRKR